MDKTWASYGEGMEHLWYLLRRGELPPGSDLYRTRSGRFAVRLGAAPSRKPLSDAARRNRAAFARING